MGPKLWRHIAVQQVYLGTNVLIFGLLFKTFWKAEKEKELTYIEQMHYEYHGV